jgi:protein-L-isoaspartate O-methyltransferase
MDYILYALNIGFLLGAGYYAYIIHEEIEALRIRIVQLSSACQLAEIQTGRPYFTSLGNKLASCEVATEVYNIARERLHLLGNENNHSL